MATQALPTQNDLGRMIESGVVLADFMAPWCDPCRRQDLILEGVGKTFQGRVRVIGVNIDNHREIAFNLGIQSIPTLILFKGGREVHRFIGLQAAGTLVRVLGRILDDPTG